MIDHAAHRFDGTIEDGVIGLQTLLSVSSLRENEQAVGLNPIVEPRVGEMDYLND